MGARNSRRSDGVLPRSPREKRAPYKLPAQDALEARQRAFRGASGKVFGDYDSDLVASGAVFTIEIVKGLTIARADLTEDSSLKITTLSVGGKYNIKSDGNGFTFSFPDTAQVIRGAYDPFRVNHIEVISVADDIQLISIHTEDLSTLLFRHDMRRVGPFTSKAEILSVGSSASDIFSAPKYSRLGSDLESFRRTSGTFRFRLVFPTLCEHITWDQKNDFVADAVGLVNAYVVTDFVLVSSSSPAVIGAGDFTAAGPPFPFGGLSWNSDHVDDDPTSVSLFDGFPGLATPYWPIGQSQNPTGDNFLVAYDNGTNTPTDIIELYAIGEIS